MYMKKAKILVTLILSCATLVGCGSGEQKMEANSNGSADTVGKKNGLPLDNLQRSRGKDTTTEQENDRSGVPLDNLDRDKKND